MTFIIERSNRFSANAAKLPKDIWKKVRKILNFLAENPRHPSLKTHKVIAAKGFYGGEVFEAYVDMQYRLTWEYQENNVIYLRNVANHDDCLKHP